VKARLGVLLSDTIWGEAALAEVPPRFRPLLTVWLPINYVLLMLYGIAGTLTRVPTIVKVAGVGYGDVWTVLIGVAGAIGLLGLIFLWALPEFAGALVVGVLFLCYVGSLFYLSVTAGDLDRLALSIGVVVFLILPAWRCSDLVRVERRRRHGA
jgi:hypothetical protein